MMVFWDRPPRYRAYLLRLWQERNRGTDARPVWRFALQDPGTGEQYGFANLESMVAFLQRVIDEGQEPTNSQDAG